MAIYSEDEIRIRLRKEHISGEHLSLLMEIILNYGQSDSQDITIAEDSNKKDDDFDLDDLTSSTNGDEL